ncbi:unnamed protein product [Brachionus calyciflorus]|uniref:PIG-P domain-containing protein n=1 Tax=Brachionus calyciflorus TaxID=104777 RepID=A0A813R3H1_9BILA|nr:unnamed protein product [Brachionus calyciflorus]
MSKKQAEHSPGPKPERALFGFFLFISSIILFILYILFSFVSDETLNQIGLNYLPDKYWYLAIPAFLIYAVLGYLPIYFLINTSKVLDYDSINNINDEASLTRASQTRSNKYSKDSIDPAYDIPISDINRFLFK